jgi:diaminohydroxyphosphoribosylaminopyrimidine deaminase/5-amino-6-(5-phosphoribosylamino)uracil reductase
VRRCLALAATMRGRTSPNPIVGCVIVEAGGRVIAEGVHRGPGTPHAELDALGQLGGAAPGATLYCNLEPCNHHGRTPPCAPAVRDAGVARVVIGMLDPIVDHGGGAELLRAAGVAVTAGVLADDCARANAPFVTWATEHRPWCVLKAAMTLDGKIATIGGASRWITGPEARADGHRLRDELDAIVVGVGTVLADDPQLTARGPGQRDPIRVVVDSALRTPAGAKLLPRGAGPRTILATTDAGSGDRARALGEAGAEIWRLPADPHGRVELPALMSRLAEAGICGIVVEGGGTLHAALLAAKLADELVLYIAPIVVGGPAPSWAGGDGIAALADAHRLAFDGPAVRFGADLRLTARVSR